MNLINLFVVTLLSYYHFVKNLKFQRSFEKTVDGVGNRQTENLRKIFGRKYKQYNDKNNKQVILKITYIIANLRSV